MSFQQILLIWLALTVIAAVGGAISHIVGRRTQNLPGVPCLTFRRAVWSE
jgi:hypothetical protein